MNGINEPLVSIIVNCYNSDKYLRETLDSVISQTYENWELIFWDNQSTDLSAEYFKSYKEPRFKYYYAPSHTSLSASRNFAVEQAKGEYLAFLDCDDVWTNEKLDLQVAALKENSGVGFVYSLFELFSDDHSKSIDKQIKYYKSILIHGHPAENIFADLLHQNHIIFSSVLIKYHIYNKTCGFNPTFHQNEDYELLLKASLYSKAICINKPLVKYRIHANNNSYKNGELNFLENDVIFNSLPYSPEVDRAIKRNQVRFNLYKIIYKKKYGLIIMLLNPNGFYGLIEIIKKRLGI